MFRSTLRSRSDATTSSSTLLPSSSPPSSSPLPLAVNLYHDDDEVEGDSSSDHEDDYIQFLATHAHHRHAKESPTTGSRNYDENHKGHRRRKKARRPRRRSLLEELRWCFLTGRLSRIVWKACALFAMTCLSFTACTSVFDAWSFHNEKSSSSSSSSIVHYKQVLNVLSSVGGHDVYVPARPIMMGVYFTSVDSSSFTGKIQRLTPPSSSKEWMQMLQHGLAEHHSSHGHILPPVQPLSDNINDAGIPIYDEETGSEFYEDEKPDYTPNPDQCTPQYEWQTKSFPSCNTIHESASMGDRLVLHPMDVSALWGEEYDTHHKQHHHKHCHPHNKLRRHLPHSDATTTSMDAGHGDSGHHQLDTAPLESMEPYRLLAHGYWRDTWKVEDRSNPFMGPTRAGAGDQPFRVALKTMRYHHNITEYVLDKQRRDAVTSDRITASNQAIHMYAYCGTTAMYEYAPGGDLEKLMDSFASPKEWIQYYDISERFTLAYNISSALADLHNTEGPGHPTGIVHGDFKPDQFVAVTPVENLQDIKEEQARIKNQQKANGEEDESEESGDDEEDADGEEPGDDDSVPYYQDLEAAPPQPQDTTNTRQLQQTASSTTVRHRLPHYKIGDFNLARFVYWNKHHNHPCVIKPDGNGGEFRAPEEYASLRGRTEKVDIYRYV